MPRLYEYTKSKPARKQPLFHLNVFQSMPIISRATFPAEVLSVQYFRGYATAMFSISPAMCPFSRIDTDVESLISNVPARPRIVRVVGTNADCGQQRGGVSQHRLHLSLWLLSVWAIALIFEYTNYLSEVGLHALRVIKACSCTGARTCMPTNPQTVGSMVSEVNNPSAGM